MYILKWLLAAKYLVGRGTMRLVVNILRGWFIFPHFILLVVLYCPEFNDLLLIFLCFKHYFQSKPFCSLIPHIVLLYNYLVKGIKILWSFDFFKVMQMGWYMIRGRRIRTWLDKWIDGFFINLILLMTTIVRFIAVKFGFSVLININALTLQYVR